jgi:hypothetical protein
MRRELKLPEHVKGALVTNVTRIQPPTSKACAKAM